jgi:hypothetical protein
MTPRRVRIAVLVILIAAGLCLSHFLAYHLGRNATPRDVFEVKSTRIQRLLNTWLLPTRSADGRWLRSDKVEQTVNLIVATESIHNLRTSIKAMRAAVKDPRAFESSDLKYFRFAARGSLAELERVIIPAIKADEAEERERNPERTVKDEAERVARIREDAREAEELEAKLAKLLEKP